MGGGDNQLASPESARKSPHNPNSPSAQTPIQKPAKATHTDTESTPAPLVVSLTSFPSRIGYLHHTLYSLFTQSDRNFTIALFLSEEEFPKRYLPLILRVFARLGLLHIHWVSENLRVYNKLFYSFRAYPGHAIITIDDDQIYDTQLIALLRASYARFPTCINTNLAYTEEIPRALEIHIDHYIPIMRESHPHIALSFLGVSGTLYPPHAFDERFYDTKQILALCPHADDLWFFIMSVLNNVEKVLISGALGHPRESTIATFESPNLWEINVSQNQNDSQLQALLAAYPEARQKLLDALAQSLGESTPCNLSPNGCQWR